MVFRFWNDHPAKLVRIPIEYGRKHLGEGLGCLFDLLLNGGHLEEVLPWIFLPPVKSSTVTLNVMGL
ncbi:hypothetical protein [Brevundimonas sp.]|uniref:hypothetical protein n=1 Tax=Brevundimonas sp. TaxID=1871086 RepID=UPI003F70BDE0